ncbi:MAG: hypothetical protein JNL92_00100 [Opitutaceae bacterium]|nr:hypothetical protein [Opitutaceae bacterium]
MRFFTLTALLAAALFSVVVALPFLPAAKMRPDLFVLEARVSSTVGGSLQIFYDDGAGMREELSARAYLTPSSDFVAHRLPLPPGVYKAIRLDPIDRGGTVRIASLRIISPTGRGAGELPLADFKPTHQVQSLQLRDGALEIVAAAGNDDPQIGLVLPVPLVVSASWRDYARGSLPLILPLFAGLAGLLLALDRLPRLRSTIAGRARALAARPGLAIGLTAALAVVASAYPVVFLGKSYVSPNLGTVLLYDTYPTLPGYKSGEVADVKLSDIGAVMWQHVPFSMLQHRALRQGELPLWNRYNAAGVPLLAQGQSMFGDPLHLFVVAANGAAWAWDLKYLVAKWLFAMGLGLTVWALLGARTPSSAFSNQRTGTSALPGGTLLAALLVALAAPFVGFFLYRINHPAFFSLCYAPWPLYCLVRVAQAETRRGVALWLTGLLVANLALMNSGTVKEAYMLLGCVNVAGAAVILAAPTPGRDRLGKLAALAWAGLIFALLTAPIWATFLQTLKNAYTGYNAVSAYQIQPTLLLGAFDEIFYRPLMTENRVFSPSLNFLLLLGVLYFLATLRIQFSHRAAVAIAVASLLPLALAFGLVSPQWIVTLPFLGNIAHLDNTFSCALIVLWSVLAGVGFATAAQRLGTRDGRHDLIVGGLLLGALVFGWIAFRQAAHRPILGPIFTVNQPGQVLAIAPFIWDYLIALLVAAVGLAVLLQRACARRSLGAASGILIVLGVAVLLWRHGLHAANVGFEAFTARPTVRVDFHARSGAMEYARAAHAREPGRGYGMQGNFFPGWTGVYGLETVHGPDALVNPWLRELIGVSGLERIWDWRLYAEPANAASGRPFLDALNVRFYFDLKTVHPALAAGFKLVHRDDLDVYESATAWPRAFFTDRLAPYDQPGEVAEKFRSAAGRPLALAQRSDRDVGVALAQIPADLGTRTSVPATDYRLTENSTSFSVKATGPGVVVLTEAFWPGDFRAEINGRKVPIVRLNHAFKGVVVEQPGELRVTIRYWPRAFPRNLALSGLGLLLLAGSWGLALRPRKELRA